MESWADLINKQIDNAIDQLKAAKINRHLTLSYLKTARKAIKLAIALEERDA